MADSFGAIALQFHDTTFDLVDHASGEAWLRYPQIAGALGYAKTDKLLDLYASHAAEFTDSMTALVKLPTAGGVQEVRIFSLRGAHLLGMFARTERASEFRRWALDVLDQQAAAATPTPPAQLVGQTFERVVAERDALRAMLAERVLKEEPKLRQVLYYYGIDGLSHRERALLCGWTKTDMYLQSLKRLNLLGLVQYEPNPKLSANGKRNMAKLRAKIADGPLSAPNPFPPGHPQRRRPGAGKSSEELARLRDRAKHKRESAKKGAAQ